MKKIIVNIFAMAGMSLILLSMVALCFQAEWINVYTVFQVLGVNIVIYFALILMGRIETKHIFIETILNVTFIVGVLLIFGKLFNWFSSTPVWTLAIMGITMYALFLLLDLRRMKIDSDEINRLIENRNKRES